MFDRLMIAFLAAGLLIWASAQGAPAATSEPLQLQYARVGKPTLMPYGWMDFCHRRPEECNVSELPALDLRLTSKTMAILQDVNLLTNTTIKPISNLDHWGTIVDHWDYPVDGMGDCKIYALWKRKILMDMGFPRQALLMTIVRDLHGDGHAVLTVKSDHGEFILDNLTDDIRSWETTGYTFIKRQSQTNPNVWLDLGTQKTTRAS